MVQHFSTFCDNVVFIQRIWKLRMRKRIITAQKEQLIIENKQFSVTSAQLRKVRVVEKLILMLHITRKEKAKELYEAKVGATYKEIDEIRARR